MENGSEFSAEKPVKYEDVIEERKCPEVGDVLSPIVGDKCYVFKSKRKERGRYKTIYFCNAHYDKEKGWVLVNLTYGLKCIISKQDKRKIPIGEKIGLYVKKLKVRKVNENKTFVICDIID